MKRFGELDSLRGLAAIAVVFHHILYVLPEFGGGGEPTLLRCVSLGPLHLFWAGHQAVVFFFVLSGFVLSLSFEQGKTTYSSFIVKRICRICIPYWLAVLLSFIAFSFFNHPQIPQLSQWFNSSWQIPITPNVVGQHLLLIGSFRNGQYNPVLWSLVSEMRISLIFPLLMLFLKRLPWQTNIFGLGLGSYVAGRLGNWCSTHSTQSPNDYWLTLTFVYMFIVGAVIARHRVKSADIWRQLSGPKKWGLVAAGLVMYCYSSWLPARSRITVTTLLSDFPTVVAVVIFIVVSLNSPTLSSLLLKPTPRFIGKISYSLYLLHGIVLLSLVGSCYGRFPLAVLLISVFPLSLLVAILFYHCVERPAIQAGRQIMEFRKPKLREPLSAIEGIR
jgi:peptidoglycan/LPS O-acetylase OafA/YrhL